MHASGVLHLDIKPDNILMDGLRVKLCDFGHSRQKANQMTRYVGTTNYLPPEFFLNPEKHNYKYGESADVWALGCVLSDILHPDQGFLLDLKSYSGEEDNLHKIAEIIRVPEYVEELYYFIDDAGMVLFALEKLPKTPKEPLTEKFKDVEDKLAIDLLEKMLNFNPNKRITIEEALKHEYMADITVEVLAKELNLDSSEVEQLENLSPSKSGEDDDYGSATEDDDCGSAEEDGDCRNTEEDGDCRNTEENDDCGSAEEDDDCGSAEEDELRDKLYDLCLSFKTGDN